MRMLSLLVAMIVSYANPVYAASNLAIKESSVSFKKFSDFQGESIRLGKGEGINIPVPKGVKVMKLGDSDAMGVTEGEVVLDAKEITNIKTREQLNHLILNFFSLEYSEITSVLRERGGIDFAQTVEVTINLKTNELWWTGKPKTSLKKNILVYLKVLNRNEVFITYYL